MNKAGLENIKNETLNLYPDLFEKLVKTHELEVRVVLQNCDIIDPENITHYIANNGYFSVLKAVTTMKQLDVINEISNSGLRGRGGGGFPTGKKWSFAYHNENDTKAI